MGLINYDEKKRFRLKIKIESYYFLYEMKSYFMREEKHDCSKEKDMVIK